MNCSRINEPSCINQSQWLESSFNAKNRQFKQAKNGIFYTNHSSNQESQKESYSQPGTTDLTCQAPFGGGTRLSQIKRKRAPIQGLEEKLTRAKLEENRVRWTLLTGMRYRCGTSSLGRGWGSARRRGGGRRRAHEVEEESPPRGKYISARGRGGGRGGGSLGVCGLLDRVQSRSSCWIEREVQERVANAKLSLSLSLSFLHVSLSSLAFSFYHSPLLLGSGGPGGASMVVELKRLIAFHGDRSSFILYINNIY